MQKMMGMKMTRYWAVMLGWDMFLYLVIATILVVTSLAFRLRIMTQTSYLIWILVLFGWGMSQIALALLLSTFFNKARTASIVAYLLVVANVVCSYVCALLSLYCSCWEEREERGRDGEREKRE